MFIIDLMYALFIGLAIAWFFGLVFGTRGPWNNFLWFFIVIFLFSWGGGVWVTPVGPTGWGVSWLPFLFMGIFITLLLSSVTPRSARRRMVFKGRTTATTNLKGQTAGEKEAEIVIDIFFWILILVLAGIIFGHYIWHPRSI